MDKLILDTQGLQLSQSDFLIRFGVSIGIGFLIGLEREYNSLREQVKGFAGIRTMVFVVLLGFMGGISYFLLSPWVYLAILAGVVLMTGLSYFITANKGDIGATTEFTVLLGFLLGTLTLLGWIEISLMVTVVMVALLSAKVKLKALVGAISAEELFALIRFVVMALLIFPFLPNQAYGPQGLVNPHEVGWVVLLTSGLGFVGYILMRILGPHKGILLSGVVGGLISSTAVTWVFSKKSKENESLSRSCAVAIMAASSVMVLRVGGWLFAFNPGLFSILLPPLAVMMVAAVSMTLFFYFKPGNRPPSEDPEIRRGKPLDLAGALMFGGLYLLILVVVAYAHDQLGPKGILISSTVAGLSDLDAITLTVSKLAGISVEFNLAANALLLASVSNTLVKMAIGVWAGGKQLRKHLLLGYGVIFLAALAGFAMLAWIY